MRRLILGGLTGFVLLLGEGARSENNDASNPYRVEFQQQYDPLTGRLTVIQSVNFSGAGEQQITVEKSERTYERGALVSSKLTIHDPLHGKLLSKVDQDYQQGALVRDDRVLYKSQRADQWFLHLYYPSGRRQRSQYGNYYQPFVSLQARDIELYRDDARNTKSHSEVRDYFQNSEIADQSSEKFNIEMCHHKREWEIREDGSLLLFQYNEYGNGLRHVKGKLEHEHVRQVNIDYAADGTMKPEGYRERKY
jgi:hypothetical protein